MQPPRCMCSAKPPRAIPSTCDKAEHHYLAAIALAEELDMRPLLARGHLGIGRLYLRAGDHDRAEDHLLTATRLFIGTGHALLARGRRPRP